jgi:nitric oxide reductase subunit B
VPGDIVFAAGAVLLAWYGLRLLRRATPRQVEVVPAASAARS